MVKNGFDKFFVNSYISKVIFCGVFITFNLILLDLEFISFVIYVKKKLCFLKVVTRE